MTLTAAQRQASANIRRWRANPAAFVYEQFGVEPDAWQLEALTAFADPTKQRISLQACAGPGKTALLAWVAWLFLSCYGAKGEHPKAAAVSITGDNLDDNLWPELAKWQARSAFLLHAFTWTKTRIYSNDHQETWFLSARSWPKSASPEEQGKTLSGMHSPFLLFLIDESGAIPDTVLRAAEQGLASNPIFGKIVQAGNPISLEGMLYAAATRLADQWTIIRITGDPDDPQRSPRIGIEWARQQIQTYGRDNPWVMSYILGKFPPSSLNTLLGIEDVIASQGRNYEKSVYEWAQARLGVDVARYGDDRTVIFPRQGKRAFAPDIMRHARDSSVSVDIATRVMAKRLEYKTNVTIMDATGGWAAGASDVLRAGDPNNPPINIQFHTSAQDKKYKNRRAEMYFRAAEWVKDGGWLPNVPGLLQEATCSTYIYLNGMFQIEAKEQVKARLGVSPDLWDSFVLTFGVPDSVTVAAPKLPAYEPESSWG